MPTKAKIQNVVDVLSQSLNPFSKVKPVTNVNIPIITPILQTLVSHPYASAGIVAGGITAVTNPTLATSVVKALIPATTKGKIILGAGTLLTAGAVIKQPAKTIDTALNLPSGIVNVGGNIANLVAEPSAENLKNLVTENPLIVGAGVVAGAVALGKGIIPAIATARQTEAIKEQTQAIENQTNQLPTTTSEQITQPQKVIPTSSTLPSGAPTQVITSSTPRKRRKASTIKEKERGNINQRVNIMVSSKSNSTGITQTKRYLNRIPLLN